MAQHFKLHTILLLIGSSCVLSLYAVPTHLTISFYLKCIFNPYIQEQLFVRFSPHKEVNIKKCNFEHILKYQKDPSIYKKTEKHFVKEVFMKYDFKLE